MNGNIKRINEITAVMSKSEWTASRRLKFCDPRAEGVFADVALRTPHCTIMRFFQPAGSSFPEHQHSDSIEVFVCEMGELPITVDGAVMYLKQGDSISIPPGADHGSARPFLEDSLILCTTVPPAPEFDEIQEEGRNGTKRRPD